MSRKCKTCKTPLWIAWLTLDWPWVERFKKFKDAEDCVDLLSKKICDRISKEVEQEMESLGQ